VLDNAAWDMKDLGRRIATAQGALLVDPARTGELLESAGEALFDPEYWRSRAELIPADRGRGAAWFVGPSAQRWVLRHYRRGGAVARISGDGYAWAGEQRVRSFAEYRLLALLHQRGLPVPAPVGARYRRGAFTYRCDLITQRIEAARPMSALLLAGALSEANWRAIGAAVGSLHRAGADHPDLNAHNVLVGSDGAIRVIDFDRGRLRKPGGARQPAWPGRNLERLRRSLAKIAAGSAFGAVSPEQWTMLLAGYESSFESRAPLP
jgi:3-deoxy-D-manno-octulosonic acid kinase